MEDIKNKINTLDQEIRKSISLLKLESLKSELSAIDLEIEKPDFWSDNLNAQSVMKRKSLVESKIFPWDKISKDISDLKVLAELSDKNLVNDLNDNYQEISNSFNSLKELLKFNGKYDDHEAILIISAGAGGTDAQDWASMLARMYTRWAELNSFKTSLIAESQGDEAGIKSATIEISGLYAFGKLMSESGVHRLVRLSPFNSDNLRQTSFAKVVVLPKLEKPDELVIDPKSLKIDVYRAGGHGGQSVNTTDSAVRITHIPTGITVSIQNERSQLQNKETAMAILQARLAVLKLEQHQDKIEELKGPNTSAEWGNQVRNYVLHPYKLVKDLRTKYETNDIEDILNGKIDPLINAYLEQNIGE